jgi:hypothetical protein
MLINHYIPRFMAIVMLAWTLGPATFVSAEDAEKPAAKSEAPVEEEAPADEPVETLKKKSDKPDDADSKPKPAAGKKDAPEKTDPPATKPKSSAADQLLEGLGLQGEGAGGNPLDTIVERMREVEGRLQKTETDKETRQLQTQIVKDLDDLIDKLKNQKPPPQSPNQNQSPPPPMGENPPDSPPRGSGQPKPQNSQKQKGGSQEKPSPGQKKQQEQKSESEKESQGKKSRDSDSQLRQNRSAAEEEARQRMAKDVWGHLPAALRQELLNVYSEKYLPKYDEMVRKYYEALAEQNRRNP